jgi:hypothetical protein
VTITISFGNMTQIGRKLQVRTQRFGERAFKAAQAAAQHCATDMVEQGKQDMKSAGNFGSERWQAGLHAYVSYSGRAEINIRFTHEVKYWRVFEYGAIIRGKPMLWIPLQFATDAKGLRARDYPKQLFRVERAGKAPLLMTPGGKGQPAEAKYFGKEEVTIPKKFHLREVAKTASRNLPQYYKEAFRNG